jgi:hypothetical protein
LNEQEKEKIKIFDLNDSDIILSEMEILSKTLNNRNKGP